MTAPLLAIVGRPNVGKSTLFNRLVGGRPALVHDTPHLTRDRRYGEVDYFGRTLRAVDTGGLDPEAEREVVGAGIHRQALRAIGEADAVLLVVDGRAGVSSVDHALARQLRATGKPLFLAVNKVDHPTRDNLVHDFHELRIDRIFGVSAAHGRGIDALVEAIVDGLGLRTSDRGPREESDDVIQSEVRSPKSEAREGPLRVAFVGRPNAGKSSLTNRLLGEERSLVHHEAGTTTDPVDAPFSIGGRDYVLVDTAGIRRKAKIDEDIEKLAVTMALGQIERADVVVLVIDAGIGPAEQDARIAGKTEESGRALVLALNKSDLVAGDKRAAELREAMTETFHFMPWAPTTMLSAQRGDGVDRLLDLVDRVAVEHARRIPTAQLNRFFAEVVEERPPPLHHGHAVRVHYLTQVGIEPPTFVLWANHPDGLAPSYKRFLANRLRDSYGFRGTPLRIVVKARKDRHLRDE
ncbi:MAG TPA: ribosome biogenesis GTPase Der [Kofleriaceae bacterium]|jgi:GTP-binding protein